MIAVVGLGRLGDALTAALTIAGVALEKHSGRGILEEAPDALASADTVVFCIRDDRLAAVAKEIAARGLLRDHHVLLHCSGSRPPDEVFAGLPGRGRAMMHPLISFAALPDPVRTFRGGTFGIAGDAAGLEAAEHLVRALGGHPVPVRVDAIALYHAGAALASNSLPGLLTASAKLLAASGVPEQRARVALGMLMAGTLENTLRLGPAEALTGPIARGDVATVKRHLDALAVSAPDLLSLYRACALGAVALARQAKEAPAPEELDAIERLLA